MQSLTISHPADARQRLDRFVKKYLPNLALGGIYKILRTGKIKVNGKKKDQTYKLELGDEITFWMTDEEMKIGMRYELGGMNSNPPPEKGEDSPVSVAVQGSFVSSKKILSHENPPYPPLQKGLRRDSPFQKELPEILFEDEFLLVVNKPAGINVHAGDHKTTESNLIDQVQDYLQGKYDSLTFRPALVHRIDRDTSGCLLIAKDKQILEVLLSDLQNHKIEKVYHVIVSGIPKDKQGTIRAKLLRVENAKNEAKVKVDEGGQSAVTHYKIVSNEQGIVNNRKQGERYTNSYTKEISSVSEPKEDSDNSPLEGCPNDGVTCSPLMKGVKNLLAMTKPISLLECRIETGRTHQIRIHMAHIGCPVIGDKAYGDKKINAYARSHMGIDRQLLHARSLTFMHPKTGKKITVEAPYPEDFEKMVVYLNAV